MKTASDYVRYSRRWVIAVYIAAGTLGYRSRTEVFQHFLPFVRNQEKPFVFKSNPTDYQKSIGITTRQPKAMGEQVTELWNEVGRVIAEMSGQSVKSDSASVTAAIENLANAIESNDSAAIDNASEAIASADTNGAPVGLDNPTGVPAIDDSADEIAQSEIDAINDADDAIAIESEVKPIAKGKDHVKSQLLYFRQKYRDCVKLLARKREQSDPIDDLGNRPLWTAARLIPAGVPADFLLHTMTLTWNEGARMDAGIRTVDYSEFVAFSRQIMFEREIPALIQSSDTGEWHPPHEMFGYVLILAEERVPVYLYGGMGTGKSFLARQVADYLQLTYGETAMSAGATRGDLYGRLTASSDLPFIPSAFTNIRANGGVFNFEELDAALPEVVIALNNALANDEFFNSSNGQSYGKSEDFIAMATGNTLMMGNDRLYIARERLDAATIDRWRMGRTEIRPDENVQDAILFSRVSQ